MLIRLIGVLLLCLEVTKAYTMDVDPWTEVHNFNPVEEIENVDPSMNLNEKLMKDLELKKLEALSAEDVLFYYKRLINTIFTKKHFKLDADTEFYIRRLHLHVSNEQFSRLTNLVKSTESLREIDGIISDIIDHSHGGTSEILQDLFETWSDMFRYYLDNTFVKVGCYVTASILAIMFLKKATGISTYGLCSIIFLIISYGWTYYSMYTAMEVKRMIQMTKYATEPPECNAMAMSFMSKARHYLFGGFGKDPCEEYWSKVSSETWQSLDPGAVAVEMVTRLVTQPMATMSSQIGMGLGVMFNSVPFPWNIIIFPIGAVILFLTFIYLGAFIFGIPVNLNLMHLIQFRIGHDQHSRERVQPNLASIGMAENSVFQNLLHRHENVLSESHRNKALQSCSNNERGEKKNILKQATFKTKTNKLPRRNRAIMRTESKRIFGFGQL